MILCDLLANAEAIIDHGDASQRVEPTEISPQSTVVARGGEGVTIAVSHLNNDDKDKDDNPDSKRQYVLCEASFMRYLQLHSVAAAKNNLNWLIAGNEK